jgi:hypothetical protein
VPVEVETLQFFRAQRLAICVDAALATVDSVLIETIAPSATKAAKIASRTRELRWRIAILSRWVIGYSLVIDSFYKGRAKLLANSSS